MITLKEPKIWYKGHMQDDNEYLDSAIPQYVRKITIDYNKKYIRFSINVTRTGLFAGSIANPKNGTQYISLPFSSSLVELHDEDSK
jgi:hypothetical protein